MVIDAERETNCTLPRPVAAWHKPDMTVFKPVRQFRGFKFVYTLEVIVDGMFADTYGTYTTLEEAKLDAARMAAEHRASAKD